jgi:hypothetical protein
MVKLELCVEQKEFKNDKGESVEYLSCTAKVGGETIRFTPNSEDKKLFKFLLGDLTEKK